MAADIKDLVSMYFERENAMQFLWQVYLGMVIGILAFVGAVPNLLKRLYLPIILSIGFIGFAYVNGDAIIDVLNTRIRLAEAISNEKSVPDAEDRALVSIVNSLKLQSETSQIVFCTVSDIAVLAALWGFVWIQARKVLD